MSDVTTLVKESLFETLTSPINKQKTTKKKQEKPKKKQNKKENIFD